MAKLKVVVFGDPGVGKTTFALTFPKVFVLDTDNGLEGDPVEGRELINYKDLGDIQDLSPSDIVYAKVRGHQDVEHALKWFVAHRQHFQTFIVDSVDGLSRTLLNEVVDEGKGKAKNLMQIFVPEQAEYGVNLRQMERILDNLAAFDVHVVVCAGVREKDGAKRAPNVIPSVMAVVNRWANLMGEVVVVRLDADGNIAASGTPHRVLMVDPSSTKRECKTRWAALLPYVQDPGYTTIADKLTKKEKK